MMKLATFFLLCFSLFLLLPKPEVTKINLKPESVHVFITGEVKESKQISIHPQALVKDVLNKIELTEEADVSNLNLNEPVYEDMIIHIFPKTKSLCVSINSASQEQLETLPTIGPSTALKIIEYREKVGPFLLLEDIMKVKTIGEKKFEKIKDVICL